MTVFKHFQNSSARILPIPLVRCLHHKSMITLRADNSVGNSHLFAPVSHDLVRDTLFTEAPKT